jgi:Flp pilus assembly protein TadD
MTAPLETHRTLAVAAHKEGRIPEAVAHYRQVLTLDPNHSEALGSTSTPLDGGTSR